MSLLENLNKRQQTVEKINLLDQIEANNKKLLDAIKENENLTNKLKSLETQPDSESGKKNEPSGLTKFLSSMFSSGSKPDTTHDTNPELKPNSDLLSAASTAVNSRSSTLQTDDEGVGDSDSIIQQKTGDEFRNVNDDDDEIQPVPPPLSPPPSVDDEAPLQVVVNPQPNVPKTATLPDQTETDELTTPMGGKNIKKSKRSKRTTRKTNKKSNRVTKRQKNNNTHVKAYSRSLEQALL